MWFTHNEDEHKFQLEYEEHSLSRVLNFYEDIADGNMVCGSICRVGFDPEFTYQTAYVVVLWDVYRNLGRISKYLRSEEDAIKFVNDNAEDIRDIFREQKVIRDKIVNKMFS